MYYFIHNLSYLFFFRLFGPNGGGIPLPPSQANSNIPPLHPLYQPPPSPITPLPPYLPNSTPLPFPQGSSTLPHLPLGLPQRHGGGRSPLSFGTHPPPPHFMRGSPPAAFPGLFGAPGRSRSPGLLAFAGRQRSPVHEEARSPVQEERGSPECHRSPLHGDHSPPVNEGPRSPLGSPVHEEPRSLVHPDKTCLPSPTIKHLSFPNFPHFSQAGLSQSLGQALSPFSQVLGAPGVLEAPGNLEPSCSSGRCTPDPDSDE